MSSPSTTRTILSGADLANAIDAQLESNRLAGTVPATRQELARHAIDADIAGRSAVLEFLRGARDTTTEKAISLAMLAGLDLIAIVTK